MAMTKALYVEADTEIEKCSFRSFKIINATFVAEGPVIPKSRLSNNIRMGFKLTVKKQARARSVLRKHL